MLEHLDSSYPNVYWKKTKFGNSLENMNTNKGNHLVEVHGKLISLFDCDYKIADDVVSEWMISRPMYENIPNSTNPDVLVPST